MWWHENGPMRAIGEDFHFVVASTWPPPLFRFASSHRWDRKLATCGHESSFNMTILRPSTYAFFKESYTSLLHSGRRHLTFCICCIHLRAAPKIKLPCDGNGQTGLDAFFVSAIVCRICTPSASTAYEI